MGNTISGRRGSCGAELPPDWGGYWGRAGIDAVGTVFPACFETALFLAGAAALCAALLPAVLAGFFAPVCAAGAAVCAALFPAVLAAATGFFAAAPVPVGFGTAFAGETAFDTGFLTLFAVIFGGVADFPAFCTGFLAAAEAFCFMRPPL